VDVSTERRRCLQVNRAFRDVILSSPLIQHKIDLYGAGFEHNPAAGIDLAESRKALRRHLSNLDPFSPVQEWVVDNPRISDDISNIKAAGGVIAMINESVRLFTLGSSSRKIPHKEWEIPLPTVAPENYGLYPGADIIAFVEVQSVMYVFFFKNTRWELTLTWQWYATCHSSEDFVDWWISSLGSEPNHPVLSKRRHRVRDSLCIGIKLPTCGIDKTVRWSVHGYLGLEKFSSHIRMSALRCRTR